MPVKKTNGFTLVEVLVISPIVILFIGAFITLIVTLTGESIQIREKNVAVYDTQASFDDIESNALRANGFLSTTGTLASPQGSDNNTAAFSNTTEDVLIMTTAATTANPNTPSRTLVYTGVGTCDSRNPLYNYITVYFLALDPDTIANTTDKALYKRTILPQTPACATPWQRGSCAEAVRSSNTTICKTSDEKLIGNVASFGVSYSSGGAAVAKENASTADSISITINSSKQVSGAPVSYSSSISITSQNVITDAASQAPAPAPSITWSRNDMSTSTPYRVTFSWQGAGNATSYIVTPTIGGVVQASQTIPSSQTSYDVDGRFRKDVVSIKLDVTTSSGSYNYGTQAATRTPQWNECTPLNGWANYDTTYNTLGYTKTSSNAIGLKGLIRYGPIGYGSAYTVCYLPPGFRPPNRLIFNGVAYDPNGVGSNGSARIDILTDGAVMITNGSNPTYTNGFVSLDGIIFMPSQARDPSGNLSNVPWQSLTWQNSWYYNSYSDTYPNVAGWRDTNRIWIQGLGTGGAQNANMVAFPNSYTYAPSGGLHYPGSSDNRGGAVNVSGTNIASRPSSGSYVSLQMLYNGSNAGMANLNLYNGWVNYNGGWTEAKCLKYSDDIVIMQGLVRAGNQAAGGMTHVGVCAPNGTNPYMSTGRRALFTGWMNPEKQGRLDLPTDGYLYPLASDPGWTSLDGIHYIAD